MRQARAGYLSSSPVCVDPRGLRSLTPHPSASTGHGPFSHPHLQTRPPLPWCLLGSEPLCQRLQVENWFFGKPGQWARPVSLLCRGADEMVPGYLVGCLPHPQTPEVTQAARLPRKGL